MKNILYISAISLLFLFSTPLAKGVHFAGDLAGYILLQVEQRGEAWYVYPQNGQRYFLGRPADAFSIMKSLALGATSAYISSTNIFPERLLGMILIDVERNGEAYYIYPEDGKKYYLGRPEDAFRIMSRLGLGITDKDLAFIPEGILNAVKTILPASGRISISVPFTPQAPFGDWSDRRQEDGCEESSALMAVRWAKGQGLTREDALKEITGSSDYTLEKYGEFRDISIEDTVNWIFKDYFNYDKVSIKSTASSDDLIMELKKGNLVIVPMDGTLLHNPYYTQPGPIRHMLVVRGYDPATKKFITNDPGTRRGEGYEYDSTVLYNAIRDYPTGFHEHIEKIVKDVIVVSK